MLPVVVVVAVLLLLKRVLQASAAGTSVDSGVAGGAAALAPWHHFVRRAGAALDVAVSTIDLSHSLVLAVRGQRGVSVRCRLVQRGANASRTGAAKV